MQTGKCCNTQTRTVHAQAASPQIGSAHAGSIAAHADGGSARAGSIAAHADEGSARAGSIAAHADGDSARARSIAAHADRGSARACSIAAHAGRGRARAGTMAHASSFAARRKTDHAVFHGAWKGRIDFAFVVGTFQGPHDALTVSYS